MTLAEKSAMAANRSSGFDYLRILLAISVVCWHTIVTTYGGDFQAIVWADPKYRLIIAGILPAFFSLSGFLVAGSLERCKTLPGFVYLRVIRIFPALIVEIAISALAIGPLLTDLSLKDYFSGREFYTYFLNCIGYVHYELPGLFTTNPFPLVTNGQLWTVPFELECYIVLSVIAFAGVTLHKKLFSCLVGLILLYGVLRFVLGNPFSAENLSGRTLVGCFLVGVYLYVQRDAIPYSRVLGWVAILASLACFWSSRAGYLAPVPVAYATVYLGLMNPRKPRVLDSGDYSYGIFLYGFPIQQAIVMLGRQDNGWINCALSLPLIFGVAYLSWHLWEKKFLLVKKYRPSVDQVFSTIVPGLLTKSLGIGRAS